MSKRKREMHPDNRSKRDAKHVRIYWWAFKSPAYRSLSCYARCVLEELLFLHDGQNNGAIAASVRWLKERLNAGTDQVRRALDELVAKGFLKATTKGGFNHKAGARKGEATTWLITMLESPNGEPASKDFMRWPGGLDTTAQKQTTVPDAGTPRTGCRYRRSNFGAKNGKSVPDAGTVKPDFDPLTVPDAGTSLVYHAGGRAADTPTREAGSSNPESKSKEPVDKIARPGVRNGSAGAGGSFERQRERALRMCDALVAAEDAERRPPAASHSAAAIQESAQRLGIPRRSINGHASIGSAA